MTGVELVIIGGSLGGLHAVEAILAQLPADFALPVVVVLHQAEDASGHLPGLLDRSGPLAAREAEDKSPLQAGRVLVAPPGYHMLVENGHVALSTEGRVHHSRPSIDVTLESAADTLGPAVAGVVLTGANEDGAAGLARISERGGRALVQDPGSAEAPRMPAAALAAVGETAVVGDLDALAAELVRLGAPA